MEWQVSGLILMVLLFIALISGVWVSVSLGIVGMMCLLLVDPSTMPAIGIIVWDSTESFILTAVPLFIFMGSIILESGVSGRFYRGLSLWLDFVPGSLAHSNIVACAIFAAISGSSVATAAAIGSVAIPEMDGRGYDRRLTYGSLAAGGTLGILIPPSIILIIYGAMVNESIGRLFIAAVIPGIILAGIFVFYIGFRTMINPRLVPRSQVRASWSKRFRGVLDVIPILALMILVLGGIYLGMTTPTEAAAMGASGALLITAIYGQLSMGLLRKCLNDTVKINSMVIFILVGAQIMSFALVTAGIPRGIVALVTGIQTKPEVILLLIWAVYLVLGCLMDALAMVLLTLPVVFPVIIAIGYDPIWFGVALVIMIEVAQITPPVGINLFVIQGISKQPLSVVAWGAIPYAFLMMFMIGILMIFPQLALWLPAKMM